MIQFICYTEKANNINFNIQLQDVGYVNGNGNWTTYIGLARELDVQCDVTPQDVVNAVNSAITNSQNAIINNQTQNKNDIINNQNQNQAQTNQKLDELQEQQQEMNDNIMNSDVSGAQNDANNFFNGFEDNTHGLTAIVTAPLNLIQSITSSTCTPLGFEAPFVDQQITLPCMKDVYEDHFGSFLTLYQTITFGVVAYWVCVNILATVRGFKDPDSDKIEVLDL